MRRLGQSQGQMHVIYMASQSKTQPSLSPVGECQLKALFSWSGMRATTRRPTPDLAGCEAVVFGMESKSHRESVRGALLSGTLDRLNLIAPPPEIHSHEDRNHAKGCAKLTGYIRRLLIV